MSVGILERVKEFMVRLVKDRAFLTQLENSTIDERNKFLKNAGFDFSKEEFETAVIKIMESKERGEFNELTEDEMVAVVGGYVGTGPIAQPLYGVIRWPGSGSEPPGPVHVQPLYGVVASPNE
ncbi:MAG: Nif11-like leader peptide family natural product precursor [Chroococcidiopsidaceae cyanobacterium CP_BM_ER_R8_30]|nr:Nif11-like leader peptide family natural product precursor [Chroococcidiopsidaceae cyanobacterium CP_BM_ER_R8_30]